MKITRRLGFAIILLLLILPYVIGIIFHDRYEKTIDIIARNLKVNLKILNYQRGWFYSDTKLAASYPLADLPLDVSNINNETALVIKQRIYHGPLIFYRNKLKLAISVIESQFDNNVLFANTVVAFDTSVATQLAIDRLQLDSNNKILYFVKGLTGNIYLNAAKNKYFAAIKLQQLIANINMPREILGFTTTQQLTQDTSGLWFGQKSYYFDQLNWRQANQDLQFYGFKTTIALQENSSSNSSKLQYTAALNIMSSLKKALINKTNYGQQQIALSLHNLDKQELHEVLAGLPMSSSIAPLGDANHLRQHLNLLFAKGAKLQLTTLDLNTGWGKVKLGGEYNSNYTNVAGKMPKTLANSLLLNYYLLNQTVSNKELATKAVEESIASFQKSGWLVPQENDYTIHFSWQHPKPN